MSIKDRELAVQIMQAAQALERLNDAVEGTPIRRAINERCVEIFLLARDGHLANMNGGAGPVPEQPFDLDGDGRVIMHPTFKLPGTRPMRMTRSNIRRSVESFSRTGHSTHSAQGGTLWATMHYCQLHRIPYVLTAYPGQGYSLQTPQVG